MHDSFHRRESINWNGIPTLQDLPAKSHAIEYSEVLVRLSTMEKTDLEQERGEEYYPDSQV